MSCLVLSTCRSHKNLCSSPIDPVISFRSTFSVLPTIEENPVKTHEKDKEFSLNSNRTLITEDTGSVSSESSDSYESSESSASIKKELNENCSKTFSTEYSGSVCSDSSVSVKKYFGLYSAKMTSSKFLTKPPELFPGAILGRTVVSRSGKKRRALDSIDLRRVDIGIGYKGKDGRYDDGISRNHVQVLNVDANGILIKVYEGVRNPIAIQSDGLVRQYGPGKMKYLQEGDVIIFDTYMKRPRHIFKIVSFATQQEQ